MKIIQTKEAPSAIGSYSQGVVVGDFVFVSGQIPLDPATGEIVDNSIEKQTEKALDNVLAVLSAINLGFENVCKMEIYMNDINNFSVINEIYANKLGDCRPARQTMQVSALPKGAKIEISCIAYIN